MSYNPYQSSSQIIYQQVVRPPSNGMAVTSLVLGIIGIIPGVLVPIPFAGVVFAMFAFLPALLAVVFGHVGKAASARVGGVGSRAALTGLILGYVTIGLIVATTLVWVIGATASVAGYQVS